MALNINNEHNTKYSCFPLKELSLLSSKATIVHSRNACPSNCHFRGNQHPFSPSGSLLYRRAEISSLPLHHMVTITYPAASCTWSPYCINSPTSVSPQAQTRSFGSCLANQHQFCHIRLHACCWTRTRETTHR